MNNKDLKKIWDKYGIAKITTDFDMGGDSGELSEIEAFDINENPISLEKDEISIIERDIYDNVQFYEVSDGHYCGENGTVTVECEDGEFVFNKEGTAEYSEAEQVIVSIKFDDQEIEYIKEYLSDFGRSRWDGQIFIYKKDFIFTERHQEIEDSIQKKIDFFLYNYNYIDSYDSQDDVTLKLDDGRIQSYKYNKIKFEMEYYYRREEELIS